MFYIYAESFGNTEQEFVDSYERTIAVLDILTESAGNKKDEKGVIQKLSDTVHEFFVKLFYNIRKFINDLKLEIKVKSKQKEYISKLKRMKFNFDLERGYEKKNNNMTVEMVDVWKFQKTLSKDIKEMTLWINNFSKKTYISAALMETDFKEFNTKLDAYNKELTAIKVTKISVPMKRAYQFVDDELNGKSEIMKTIEESVDEFRRIEKTVDDRFKYYKKFGESAVPFPAQMNMVTRAIGKTYSLIGKFTKPVVMDALFAFTGNKNLLAEV